MINCSLRSSILPITTVCLLLIASANALDMLVLRDGSKVIGYVVAEDNEQITIVDSVYGKPERFFGKASVIKVERNPVEGDLRRSHAIKDKCLKEIGPAEEKLRPYLNNVTKANDALFNFRRERLKKKGTPEQERELDKQEVRLKLEAKGAEIEEAIHRAKVEAIQKEIENLNRVMAILEKLLKEENRTSSSPKIRITP